MKSLRDNNSLAVDSNADRGYLWENPTEDPNVVNAERAADHFLNHVLNKYRLLVNVNENLRTRYFWEGGWTYGSLGPTPGLEGWATMAYEKATIGLNGWNEPQS